MNECKLNYLRADYILEQSKLLGYRVIGSLFWDYMPDAIIILPIEKNKEYYEKRKSLNKSYDKNLTWQKIIECRNYLLDKAKKFNIPIFDNCTDAINHFSKFK